MDSYALELALRKQRLQFRSAALREALTVHLATWTQPVAAIDRVNLVIVWLRRHPVVPVAVIAVIAVSRPRALFLWARRGFFVWRALHRLRSMIESRLPL